MKSMTKAISQTKEKILEVALDLSSRWGLVNLSIGELAKVVGMSKSGLFGHFKSKESLQKMVLDLASMNFVQTVIKPATKKSRGIPRLQAIVENWITWSTDKHQGGCPIVTAIIEFDDRPGSLRDHVKALQKEMLESFKKAVFIAVEEGHFDKGLSTDQFVYELYSYMVGFHIFARLMNQEKAKAKLRKSFRDLVARSSKTSA